MARRLQNASNVVQVAGGDMVAQIVNRVIETGQSADGSKFSPYSKKEVPAFWYLGKSLNQTGESRVKAKAKKKEGVSYSDFRSFNGRPVNFKNFSFSQSMWRGVNTKGVQHSGGIYELTFGGTNKDSSDKLGFMASQEGRSIIQPNAQELERLKRRVMDYVLRGS